MDAKQILTMGAAETARAIRRGDLLAREATEARIARIRETHAALNAVVLDRFEAALADADKIDAARGRAEAEGALLGVPITIKESFHVEGLPTTAGVDAYRGRVAEADGALVARFRRAGAVVLGKTNLAQLLFYLESDNPVYGRCNNPWNTDRTPGGSSGGEGAIIACGGSPLGLGSDIGGSVRGPAHFCGIHGFKPTSGRLDPAGSIEDLIMPGQEAILSQAGVLARRVEDIDLAMGVLLSDEPPSVPWRSKPLGILPKGSRVGVFEDNGYVTASPAIRRAVREAAEALRERGAEIVPFEPPDVRRAYGLFTGILTADGGACLRRALAGSRADKRLSLILMALRFPSILRPLLRMLARVVGQRYGADSAGSSGPFSADKVWRLVAERNRYRARFLKAMDDANIAVVLSPPLATPALHHGSCIDAAPGQSYAGLWNLLGMPAGVVAATRVRAGEESDRAPSRDIAVEALRRAERGSEGLPVGVQVAGRPYQDEIVVAAMAAVEAGLEGKEGYPAKDLA